jgi:hypothetical protein
MKRVLQFVIVAALAAESLVLGQGADAAKVLAEVRQALGGDAKLAAVKTLAANGRSTRVNGDQSAPPTDFEVAIELPDKYVRKDVIAVLGSSTISRTSGFNGDGLIDVTDTPPNLGGGGTMVFRMGPGGAMPGQTPTPEQQAEMRKNTLLSNRQDFARLTLGMFAASFSGYPLTFTAAGQAESPDGKADLVDVKGDGGFTARLFIDGKTRLPLLLSWMAKEPMVMNVGPGGVTSGSGSRVVTGGGSAQSFSGQPMTPEQRDQLMKDLDARMKEADARRRVVEYRVYYSDYQDVGGVKLPFRLQRAIEGKPVEEVAFDKIKVNQKIDPKKFDVSK